MFRKLLCLITLIAVSGLCEISLGVSLKVDVGVCGPVQKGWIPLRGARGKLNKNVGGTNIDVMVTAGADSAKGSGGECRCDSGSTHELAAVETTYIKKDARRNARSPKTDISLTLRDLEPGAEYTLYTYHHRWGEDEDPITNIIVTGATNVTKPDIILQKPEIMDDPAKFIFTAGSGDVVIRYQCLDGGQPFFNGFRLYGGSASVQFGSASSGAMENVTSAKIPVTINDAKADKTYTVDYTVTGGSAKTGDDYTLASGKLVFAPGSTTEYISLDIKDDDIHEDNETVVIELSNAKGPSVLLGTPTKHTYTIIDPRPKVLFARASGSGMEKDTPAYVPVRLSAPTRKKVAVDYAVIGGTATGGGIDYTLDSGTVVFEPGKTDQTIPITIISDSNDTEPTETIIVKLSNPTNALPGEHTVYRHTIVSQPIDLKIDLAVPTCDGKGLYQGLAKPGWTIWADQSWKDMYMHDGVWLPSRKDPAAFAAGIEGTGVKAFLSTGSEGQLGIGAKGVCRANLGGGGCPKGKASGDPIANSWAYAVDWAGPYAGDIILLLKDLPAGTYELYSYHNHWEPCKQKNRNCLDCICGMPPMPSITANPLPAKPDKTPQDLADNILKRYRWNLPLGTGKGVMAIENAYNVAPQHVLSDEELIPSVIKFATDGSEVLIIYQADRSLPLYPDCARKGREGARGILNAFRLVLLEDAGSAGYADSDTAGLWLFDEFTYPHTTLTDASEYAKADLCLMEGGSMTAGKFGNALKVTGSDYAVCYAGFAGKVPQEEMRGKDGVPSGLWGPTEGPEAVLNALAGNNWTIELWINLDAVQTDISIIDMGQAYEPGLSLTLSGGVFELTNHYAGVKAVCRANIYPRKWHHAAFTGVGKKVRLFLDGVEQAPTQVSSVAAVAIPDLQKPKDREHESRGFENMTVEQQKQNRFNFAIGTDRHAAKAMKGKVDEMQISRVVRYSGSFEPVSFSKNYGSNRPTAATADGPALLFDPKPVSEPLNFGTRKYMFIDDAIIDKKENVHITMNQPYDKEALKLDFKIKKSAWRPSVFEVGDEIFMAIPESYSSNEGLTVLATSKDGLSFKRKTKIIPETPMYGAFFKDLNPNVPAEHRYKVNSFVANRGMYFYTSPDGLNWRRNETIQLPLVSGGGGECYWDGQRGVYISFIKRDSSFRTKKYPGIGPHGHKAIMFESDEILKPWPFKAIEKPWYEGWPFPSVTGEGLTVFTAQKYGWVYRTRAIKYPWAPDVYLAFIWRYPGDDGARHVELAVSRSGRDWKLFGTNWYIPTGAADEEITMYGLLRRGDEIWQYVNEGGAHGGSAPRTWYRYKQRLDGFVSLDAGAKTAAVTTLPLKFEGSHLALNIQAAGSAKVAITDENGKAFQGFDFDDCDQVKGDFIDKIVTWKSGRSIKALQGRVIRLKLQMQDAKLYAFEFKD